MPVDQFEALCDAAAEFFRTNLPEPGERVILVDAMSQDLRVSVRTLTVANAIRQLEPSRMVVFSGTDEEWNDVVWSFFDLDVNTALAHAYGAVQVVDIHALVDTRASGDSASFEILGEDFAQQLPDSTLSRESLDAIDYATSARMRKIVRLGNDQEDRDHLASTSRRSREFGRVWHHFFETFDVVAVVTSHVDYNAFGIVAQTALQHDVPVVFPQSTGSLKSYAIFPEHQLHDGTIRSGLTLSIAEQFDRAWAQRDHLRPVVERAVWRYKGALGQPAWWRGGGSFSSIDISTADQRSALREHVAPRLGLDPARPIVGTFNHAVSDALGTNREAFSDLGAWFEATAEYASGHPEVQWAFFDHPTQALYDDHEFFATVAEQYRDQPHMVFRRSIDLSKNAMTSIVDLALTVRGSISNEMPVFGIPAIQTGWSEWSHCGFTTRADSVEEYVEALDDHLDGLLSGRDLITPEQVQRARLWLWFYRAATDVPSMYVPQWSYGMGNAMFRVMRTSMTQVESDADLGMAAVHRMWRRREPFMTRIDLTENDAMDELLTGVDR